jgi:hypothetical protein
VDNPYTSLSLVRASGVIRIKTPPPKIAMSVQQCNEGSTSVEIVDMCEARTSLVKETKSGRASSKAANSNLPSPVGWSAVNRSSGGAPHLPKQQTMSGSAKFRNINFGHRAFILAGGESNPGPPKRQPARGPRINQPGHQDLVRQVDNFRLTEVYLKGRDKIYPDAAALARFNNWVQANIAQIDPAQCSVCAICGDANLILCDHHVVAPPAPPAQVVAQVNPVYQWGWWRFVKPAFRILSSPKIELNVQNNRYIGYLGNEHIDDQEIIPDLYNYITVNQQTSYLVNGYDSRPLRLAHSHKLAHRWAEAYKRSEDLVTNTVFANQFKITIQRAADQVENHMFYGYSNPTANFGLAWLPNSSLVFYVLAFLVCFLALKVVSPILLPTLAELAVWHYMGSFRLLIITAWTGSLAILKSLMAMLLELLLHVIFAVPRTQLFQSLVLAVSTAVNIAADIIYLVLS